jgi:hypothetical protein
METLSIEELLQKRLQKGFYLAKTESSRRKLVLVFMEP